MLVDSPSHYGKPLRVVVGEWILKEPWTTIAISLQYVICMISIRAERVYVRSKGKEEETDDCD